MKDDIYQADLEVLTHKLYKGDLTPIVFDLLKDTIYLDSLIHYLGGKPPEKEEEDNEDEIKPQASFIELFNNGLLIN